MCHFAFAPEGDCEGKFNVISLMLQGGAKKRALKTVHVCMYASKIKSPVNELLE